MPKKSPTYQKNMPNEQKWCFESRYKYQAQNNEKIKVNKKIFAKKKNSLSNEIENINSKSVCKVSEFITQKL